MEIKAPISEELKSMAQQETHEEMILRLERETKELDELLISLGGKPTVKGNEKGYSIIFTNKPLQESKKIK